jgi:hypothetical protein
LGRHDDVDMVLSMIEIRHIGFADPIDTHEKA